MYTVKNNIMQAGCNYYYLENIFNLVKLLIMFYSLQYCNLFTHTVEGKIISLNCKSYNYT